MRQVFLCAEELVKRNSPFKWKNKKERKDWTQHLGGCIKLLHYYFRVSLSNPHKAST